VLQTFLFTIVYLVLVYDASVKKLDRVLRGLCASSVLLACLSMTLRSSAALNPAIGIAQSAYMIGLLNSQSPGLGGQNATYMWVYIVFPFIGAILAASFYFFHRKLELIDRRAKDLEPNAEEHDVSNVKKSYIRPEYQLGTN
jgi:glycerol uptake facilitator-like aquaporin